MLTHLPCTHTISHSKLEACAALPIVRVQEYRTSSVHTALRSATVLEPVLRHSRHTRTRREDIHGNTSLGSVHAAVQTETSCMVHRSPPAPARSQGIVGGHARKQVERVDRLRYGVVTCVPEHARQTVVELCSMHDAIQQAHSKVLGDAAEVDEPLRVHRERVQADLRQRGHRVRRSARPCRKRQRRGRGSIHAVLTLPHEEEEGLL